jgi:hypothetical protein
MNSMGRCMLTAFAWHLPFNNGVLTASGCCIAHVQMVLLQHKQRHHLVSLMRCATCCPELHSTACLSNTHGHVLMGADCRLPDKAAAAAEKAKPGQPLPADLLCRWLHWCSHAWFTKHLQCTAS